MSTIQGSLHHLWFRRGLISLPLPELRRSYHIHPGDVFHLIDLDGVFVLTPMKPMVPELSQESERARTEAELGMDELLSALREER